MTPRPRFDWDARIRMQTGVWVRVHDAYIAGEGMWHAALFGLISRAHQRDTGDPHGGRPRHVDAVGRQVLEPYCEGGYAGADGG